MPLSTPISATRPRLQYLADGVHREFLFSFALTSEEDLEVYVGSAQLTGGFVVTRTDGSEGGSVIFDAPPEQGQLITLRRHMAVQRTSAFQESARFRAKDLNDELDSLTAAVQQLQVESERSLRLGPADRDADLILPEGAGRAESVICFDTGGNVSTRPVATLVGPNWRDLDDVPEGPANKHFTKSEQAKLSAIPATAQPNPQMISVQEKADARETAARSFSPSDICEMVSIHAKPVNVVASVHGRSGVIMAQPGDYNADQIADTATRLLMTAAERSKLGEIQTGAEVNTVDSVHGRTGAVVAEEGDYNADQIIDTSTRLLMTIDERSKLVGIQAGAQINPPSVTALEKMAAASTEPRLFSPKDIADMIAALTGYGLMAGIDGGSAIGTSASFIDGGSAIGTSTTFIDGGMAQ